MSKFTKSMVGASEGGSGPSHVVLTCMDYRHMDDLVFELGRALPAPDPYDHLIVPGASLGVIQVKLPTWSGAFWSQLDVARQLHGSTIKEIWLVEHMDCGAYREFLGGGQSIPPDREEFLHRAMAGLLSAGVTRWCAEQEWGVAVKTKIMRPDGTSADWTLHPLPPL